MSERTTNLVPMTFPEVSCPTVFADGVLNLACGPGITKHYLYRLEPSFQGDNQFETQPIAQVVMPIEGFVAAAFYFNVQIGRLIASNLITQERVDEIKRVVELIEQ